jgi:hypothetical protein
MTLYQLLLPHLVRSYFIIVKIMFLSNYWVLISPNYICLYHLPRYDSITSQICYRCVTFLADTKSYKSTLNLCFTMPAIFIFTKFIWNKLKKLSTLCYCSLIHIRIVDFEGKLCQPSNKPHNHVVAIHRNSSMVVAISKSYPQEPLCSLEGVGLVQQCS